MFHKLTINTMDKTLILDSEYLFALCITDGLLEEMDERQRSLVLLTTTQMLRKKLHADSDRKNTRKVSK
jgi:hypothetical protein